MSEQSRSTLTGLQIRNVTVSKSRLLRILGVDIDIDIDIDIVFPHFWPSQLFVTNLQHSFARERYHHIHILYE